MLKLLVTVIFLWLLVKAIGFALKLTWGVAKIIACVLMVAAFPVLALCLLFAGGLALLAPLAILALAAIILRACR